MNPLAFSIKIRCNDLNRAQLILLVNQIFLNCIVEEGGLIDHIALLYGFQYWTKERVSIIFGFLVLIGSNRRIGYAIEVWCEGSCWIYHSLFNWFCPFFPNSDAIFFNICLCYLHWSRIWSAHLIEKPFPIFA